MTNALVPHGRPSMHSFQKVVHTHKVGARRAALARRVLAWVPAGWPSALA